MNILTLGQKKNDLKEWLGNEEELINFKDLIAPAIFHETYHHMQLGNNISKTLVVTDFPGNVKGNWLSELYRLKGNVNLSYHLEPTSSERMIKHLDKSIVELETRLEGNLKPRTKEKTENKLRSAKLLLKKLTHSNNSTIWKVSLYIQLIAQDTDHMEQLQKSVMNTIVKAGLRVQEPKANMEKGFLSGLPLQENHLGEMAFRNMDTEAASSLFPFDESEIFEQSGIIKGINMTTGSLVLVDLFKLKNHNEFIIGTSGAGKSFSMKKDMLRHFMQGFKIFIIDPEKEYRDIVQACGGQVVKISAMSKTIINPFEILHGKIDTSDLDKDIDEEEETPSLLHQKIQRLKIFFKMIKKNLTDIELAILDSVLIEVYKGKGIVWETDFDTKTSKDFPILEDLYNVVKKRKDARLNDFEAILETYVTGSNSMMFNGHTNVNLHSDMVCFDMSQLEDESDIQPAAMYNILSFLWDEITKDKTQKRLYIDEAHIMADPDNPRPMKFMRQVFKRIRKYKSGVTAATQQIADFLSAVEGKVNHGKAVIGNSQSKLLLGMEPGDIADIREYKALNLSKEEERILKTANQGEGIYIAGQKRVHIKIDVTPAELKLIDPEAFKAQHSY